MRDTNNSSSAIVDAPELNSLDSFLPPNSATNGPSLDPPQPILSEPVDLVNLLDDWLSQEDDHSAAENALTLLFADSSLPAEPVNQFFTSVANTPRPDWLSTDFTAPYLSSEATGHMQSNERSSTLSHQTSSQRRPDLSSVSAVPSQAGQAVNTSAAQLAKAHRTTLAADTWESGISQSQGASTPRPDRPYPSRITSPEQVVGELQVDMEAEASIG